jgi:hypothetical protein
MMMNLENLEKPTTNALNNACPLPMERNAAIYKTTKLGELSEQRERHYSSKRTVNT